MYCKISSARARPKNVLPIFCLSLACCNIMAGSLAAQTTQPGQTSPISPERLTLFPDDELFSFSPDGPNGAINTRLFQTDYDANLSLGKSQLLFSSPYTDPIVASSGRVIQPDRDTLVTASRVTGTSQLNVQTFYQQHNNSFIITNTLGDRSNGIDVIAIATGDLDRALDSQHSYHDEVAVAYLSNAGTINLTVLNFSNGDSKAALASLTVPVPESSRVSPSDNPLAAAIGDFDNDGNNEIALAYVGSSGITVTIYRYTTDNMGGGTIQLANSALVPTPSSFNFSMGGSNTIYSAVPLATVSLQVGDFQGVGFDELAVGYAVGGSTVLGELIIASEPGFSILKFDTNLQAALTATHHEMPVVQEAQVPQPPSTRVELASGQFLFNNSEPTQYPFGQHQLVIAWNDSSYVSNVYDQPPNIHLQAYYLSNDQTVNQIGNPLFVLTDPTPQFSLVAGGFMGNGNINSPTASLALSAWAGSSTGQGIYSIKTIAIGAGGLTVKDSVSYSTGRVDEIERLPLVAGDWKGNSVYLGAPVHITISNATRTNYILEQPPSLAYWDNAAKQVDTVSRYATFNTSYSNESTSTTSNKSTDHSTWTIGGSVEASAGGTFKAGANFGIAKGDLEASVTVTGKVGYDYNQNKQSYDGNSETRDLKVTATTELDDYLNYRSQLFDVWRYRAYGVTQKAPNSNSFYEIVLPGPSLSSSVGGLDADWYQPIHENGNILSYPSALGPDPNNPYIPSDLGSFKVGADSDAVSEPLVPASQLSFDGIAQTQTLRYSSTVSSGSSFDYANTLGESLDVKASATASAQIATAQESATVSGDVEFHNSNSWGSSQTSDNSLTTDTSMSINLSSGSPDQSYEFFPVLYAATDGTIKMSFAVPNPATVGGSQQHWAKRFGTKPDPALNLPRRFQPAYSQNGTQNGWTPETDTIRKKMRGLFFRRARINPTDNDYDYLNGNATTGDVVRVEARVYNYSTAQMASRLRVTFKAIPYDSSTDSEICEAPINGNPGDTGGLICPDSARTTIGSTTTAPLNPLQFTCLSGTDDNPNSTGCAAPTFINWDTTSLGPKSGTATYRIYVTLDPTDETYGSDGVPVPITDIKNTQPMVVTTSAPHGLESGDYVTIGQVKGLTDANAVWQVTVVSPTTFQLNGTLRGVADYAGGGAATLLNPGQNNEGYGVFSITAPNEQLGASKAINDYLKADSVQAVGLGGRKLTVDSVKAVQFRPLRVRVTVFSSSVHPLGTRLRIFDGNPAERAPVIADQLVHPGNNGAEGSHIWITWTPKTAGTHQLYAQLLEQANDLQKGDNTASLDVDVLRAGDVNRDGNIDRADLNEEMKSVGNWALNSACGTACDLDGDGVISVLDIRKLVLICGSACAASK